MSLKDENLRLNFHKEAVKVFESTGIDGEFEVIGNNKVITVAYYYAKDVDMVDSTVDNNAKYKKIKVRVLCFNEKI